jgi:hypothetical protein
MKIENKKTLIILITMIMAVCFLWLALRSVEIVNVYQRNNFSDVLIKNLPLTEKGKIEWWLKNEEMLKKRYDIPKPSSYGSYSIIFWDFSSGYIEKGKYDRMCFPEMRTKANCIEKESHLVVRHYKSSGTYFILSNGEYRINEKGKIVKIPVEGYTISM